jgi:hypothetical protein
VAPFIRLPHNYRLLEPHAGKLPSRQASWPPNLVGSGSNGQHLNTGAGRIAEKIGEWQRHRRQFDDRVGQLLALSGEEREWDAARLQIAR